MTIYATPIKEQPRKCNLVQTGSFTGAPGMEDRRDVAAVSKYNRTIGYIVRLDLGEEYRYGYVAGGVSGWMAHKGKNDANKPIYGQPTSVAEAARECKRFALPRQALVDANVIDADAWEVVS